MLHALLKLDGKAQESGVGKFQTHEAAVSKCEVYGAARLGSVPALAGSYLAEQARDQAARSYGILKIQEEIAGHWKVVTTQNKALNIGLVEFTHFDRQF